MSGRSFGSAVQLKTLATPTANPPSGAVLLYIKADGKVYTKTSAGVEAAVGGGGAGDMVLATDQVVTAPKRFTPGSLLMRSADGLTTAEPYSDLNAPGTLERTVVATPTGNPPAGESFEWTSDGKSLDMRASDGTITRIGPSAGGGGGASGPELAATTDYTTTVPTSPTTGLKLYTRFRARRLPSFVGPTGVDSALQPAFFTNRIGRYSGINATAALGVDALPAPTNYTTAPTAVTSATTNFFAAMVRTRFPSVATANSFAGFRIANPQWFLSTTPNLGGIFWVFRFGISAASANSRGFVGLSATNANEANADPSTLLNRIGFGFNTASANWYFHSAGAAANATVVDLGAAFPARTYATNFFEFRIFAPSAMGQNVWWTATRLNDATVVSGGPVTTNLPALNTMLTHHSWVNNVTAAVASMDVQSLYVETDN